MLLSFPSGWTHTATASPLPPMPTWGDEASPFPVSTGVGVPQPVAGSYRFAQMLSAFLSCCTQTATAFPPLSAATCGAQAFPSPVSIEVAVPQPALRARSERFDHMLSAVPSNWTHTA